MNPNTLPIVATDKSLYKPLSWSTVLTTWAALHGCKGSFNAKSSMLLPVDVLTIPPLSPSLQTVQSDHREPMSLSNPHLIVGRISNAQSSAWHFISCKSHSVSLLVRRCDLRGKSDQFLKVCFSVLRIASSEDPTPHDSQNTRFQSLRK